MDQPVEVIFQNLRYLGCGVTHPSPFCYKKACIDFLILSKSLNQSKQDLPTLLQDILLDNEGVGKTEKVVNE